MKTQSHATREYPRGLHTMVPKLVTRSRNTCVASPSAKIPKSLENDGLFKPSHSANGNDAAARSAAHTGKITSEWVMLRCHSIMARGFRASGPANISMSGKIEPIVHATIATRAGEEL